MGTTHFDKVSGITGVYVGKKGAEVAVASLTGQLYQSGTAVTSTAAELNVLDGITTTVAELNILDGVTATAAEINLIDGSVAGTAVASKALSLGTNKNVDVLAVADLKLGAGAGTSVTSTAAELNILDGVTATMAEINLIDGSVAGTAVASKVLALGTDKNVDVLAVADLKLGAGAGTSVTSTAAELNILDGVTKTASEINLLAAGVAAGYKIARGVATIGSASDDVAAGLTTVVAAVVSLVGDPSLTHMYSSCTVGDQAGAPAAGSIRIKSWKPTATGDVTPTAATSTFANVAWIAIGT